MNDFESNWKNSEVARFFAELYQEPEVTSSTTSEVPTVVTSSSNSNIESPVSDLENYNLVTAELYRDNVVSDLKKVAEKASLDGNHAAVLIIEQTIDDIFNS